MSKSRRKTVKRKTKTEMEIPQPVLGPTPTPTLAPETVQKLQQLVAELIVLGGELGMEIACSECMNLLNCEIVKKSREIVQKVKQIREELKSQMQIATP